MNFYTLDNEVFEGLVLYVGLSLAKLVGMSFLVAYHRVKNYVFLNPEDVFSSDPEKNKRKLEKIEVIERVRRAHMNDVENILPFGLMAMLYVATNPSPTAAVWHFKVFFVARLLHTVAYLSKMGLTRTIAFFVAGFVFFSVALQTICAAL